jgi:hypothetical protein
LSIGVRVRSPRTLYGTRSFLVDLSYGETDRAGETGTDILTIRMMQYCVRPATAEDGHQQGTHYQLRRHRRLHRPAHHTP